MGPMKLFRNGQWEPSMFKLHHTQWTDSLWSVSVCLFLLHSPTAAPLMNMEAVYLK